MKIAIIIPSLSMGGGEKFSVDLANELAKNKNNQVTLCIISKIHKSMILFHKINSNVNIICMEKSQGFDYRILFKIKKKFQQYEFDIVHTNLRGILYSLWSIISFRKIKYVHTLHNLVTKETSSSIYRFFLKQCFNYLNVQPVAIAPEILNDIHQFYGKQHKIMILNGVAPLKKSSKFKEVQNEISTYKQNQDTKVLINLGRVTEQKNQKLLIKSFKEIKKNVIVLIIGSLDNEPIYSKECQELAKDSSNIFFLGEKSNVGDYLYCSDALCLSSIYEGLPLVILEAISIGKPTLSTNVGGIPDVIENTRNGYLSKNISVSSYINMINIFIKDTKINNKAISSTFEKKYSMNICSSHYYNLYRSLICP
jgi:glycosyltransferase involved in cell wall biosynthesis